MANELMCGAAKRNITPSEELMGKLFCVMPNTKFEVVDDDLFVRVIALKSGNDTVLFVHYELDQAPFPHKSMEEIYEKYSIPAENIFFLGNHSHEVPVTGIRAAEPEHNAQRISEEFYAPTTEYEKQVLDAMHEAVDEAMSNMQPAKIGWGEGESLINVHRDMRFDSILPIDHTLFVLKIEALDGTPIAFMLNFSSHNNCVKLDNALSADMEGCISHLMEDYFAGSVSMWTLSAHGDLMARMDYWNVSVNTANIPEFADPEKTDEMYIRRKRIISLRQFEDALKIISEIKCSEIESAEILGSVEYVCVPTYPVTENPDGSITHMGGKAVITSEQRANLGKRAASNIARLLNKEAPDEFKLRLHTVRLGKLVFVGNGGKLYNGYKMLIRSMFPVEYKTVILSQDTCESSTVTYIYDDQALLEQAANCQPVTVRTGEISEGIRKAMKKMLTEVDIETV